MGAGQADRWEFLFILLLLLQYKGGDLRGPSWPTGSHLPAYIGIHLMPADVTCLPDLICPCGRLFLTSLSRAWAVFGIVS